MGGRFIKVMVAETAMAVAVAVAVWSVGAATAMIGIASDAAVPVVGSPHTKKLAWNHTRARKSSRASTIKHTAWMAASRRCFAQISTAKAASPKNEGVAVRGPGASRFGDLEHRRQALVGNQPGSLFYNRSGSWLPSLVYEERHQIIQWRGFGGLDSLESQ